MAKTGYVQDFDDILQQVGSFGRYQKLRIAIMFVPTCFILGFVSISTMFELVLPPYWCHVPGRDNTSFTLQQWKALTLPPVSDDGAGKLSSCLMYDGSLEVQNGSLTYVTTGLTKKCSNGYDFDQDDFTATDPTTHEWFCEKEYYVQNALSINMAGRAVGTLFLPMMADKFFGRRRMYYIAVSTYVIFTLPLLWVRNGPGRLLFRFLQGIGYETNYLMPYVIMMELIPPSQRDVTVMLTFVSWTLGSCFMSLVAYLAADWKLLEIISMLPMIFSFVYWKLLPESPRWLLSKGRLRECADILLQISASNKTGVAVTRQELEKELHTLSLRLPPNEPLTKAFIYPKLRLRAAILFFLSFCIFLVYGVVILNMTILPGNYFVSHAVLTVFEVPSVFVGLAVTHYFGRRFLAYFSISSGALCLIAATFYVDHMWKLVGVLSVLKLSLSCGLYHVFLLPSEILPTPIRTSGAGLTVVCGMLGMVVSPQLIHSGMGSTFHYWVCLGVILAAALSITPVPETLGLLMPQTMVEGEELGQGRPLTSWIHHWNLHKYPVTCNTTTPQHQQEEEQLVNGKA